MRRTARLMVVIFALAAGGLLWKGEAPDLPNPESLHFSPNPPRWDPVPEYDSEPYDGILYDGIWPLPGAQPDGALDVEEDYKMYVDY